VIRVAVLVALSVLGSALCSLGEAAVLASSEARIRAAVQAGRRGSRRLLALKRDPAPTLASIVFLNNVFQIAGTALITSVAAEEIHTAPGMLLFIVVQTVLMIAFGEILPKVVGEAHPETIAMAAAPWFVLARVTLRPFVWLLEHLVGWARPKGRVPGGQEVEITELARMGSEGGHVAPEEAALIHRVFRLDDITAADVMTPRALVNAYPAGETVASHQEELLAANHSQFPVYETDLDDVVGTLQLRDALGALARGEGTRTFRDLMRPPLFLPPTRPVDDALRDLQQGHRQMAMVIDEYGATLGIITMDDLVEELIGEAIDETAVSEGLVKRLSKTAALMHGLTRVGDAALYLKVEAEYERPEDRTTTVTGLLQERLGRIPEPGDRLELPGGLLFEVREADGRMATRVLARNVGRPT
jgi:CBS domain containing-hemolysin-like protein